MREKPRNTLADLVAAVVSVFVAGMIVLLLPVPSWIAPLLGGAIAVYALEARLGQRVTNRLNERRPGSR